MGKKKKSGPKARGASSPVLDVSKIPEGKRKVLLAYPIRSPSKDLKWYRNKKEGTITIKIRKQFSRTERKLRKVMGGPAFLRIPLDGPGSHIWELCDGEHNVLEITQEVHERFKEEVEPVPQRIIKFLEILLKRNLILFKRQDEMKGKGTRKKRTKKGKKARGAGK
jgi:hypothetical protein